jgi:predicted enzyme related to lactoylglutathione lyase
MLGIRLADDMYYPSADAFRWTIPRLSRSVIADKMAAQLRAAGIEVKINEESSPIGRFARLHDPEGNPIELWQPAG